MSSPALSSFDPSNRLATPSPPPRVSALEAKLYYYGLFSQPRLIARTGYPWDPPEGPEAYPQAKELRIPGEHKLFDVWEDNIALKVHDILNRNGVNWSSTDIVRIAYVDEPLGNLTLWIGVRPRPTPLSYEVGLDVAVHCKRLLLNYGIADVDVELRESDIIQTVRPYLIQPTDIIDPTAILREPFTTTLGITICAQNMPWAEGTAGFFLGVTGLDKLYLVTARHVLFPRSGNEPFEHSNESQPHNVQVLSESSFQRHLLAIDEEIKGQDIIVAHQQDRMNRVADLEDDTAVDIRKDAEREVKKAKTKAQALTDFHRELLAHWSSDRSRTLGHVIYSPPILVGAGTDQQQYTQDIAVIDVDPCKIDPNRFPGNFLDLGTKYTPVQLTRKICPNPYIARDFTFPGNRLLKLRGTIPTEEMRHPKMLDGIGDPCIIVLKRGRTTNLTVGKGTTFVSYTRKYLSENDTAVSKEWLVLPYDKESGVFSAKGDSGSVVVDGSGRIAGILTSGSGVHDICDATYVTPIDFIMEIIHKHRPLAEAYIKSAPSA